MTRIRHAKRSTLLISIGVCAARAALGSQPASEVVKKNGESVSAAADHPLSALAIWDDGLSEMSYYRASEKIYGKRRDYVRVQLLNRQWMDRETGVKTNPTGEGAVAVFKFNVAEEIPTENYNYRFLTTVFLQRPTLRPFKMVVSSQEWCGASFKKLRWQSSGLDIQSFSYFSQQGDRTWRLENDVVPYEALPVIARDVAARGKNVHVNLLVPMRSNREVKPVARSATLVIGKQKVLPGATGRATTLSVSVQWDGPETVFDVDVKPPYRLMRYRMGPLSGELLRVERRAYWDRTRTSSFYKSGQAP